MRIWDTFLYCGLGPEPDLLRARVAELRPVYNLVHVPVCGNMTFQGDPLDYPKTDWRVPPWADGMDPRRVKQYNYVARPGEPETMWDREHYARRATANALREFGAARGDLVLHGDVDEIPNAATVAELARWRHYPVPVRLSLRFAMFAVDWEYPERKLAPVAAGYHPSMLDFAGLRMGGWPVLPEGPHGWHLSSLGGEAAVRQKVHTFSHAEAIPEVEAGLADDRWIREGVFWPGLDHGEVKLTPVDTDETWPATIREPATCPAEWFRIR